MSSPSKKAGRKGRNGGSKSGSRGVILSLVFSSMMFLSLLVVFDPIVAPKRPSAIHAGLDHFSSGHLKSFNETHVETAAVGREPILHLLREAGIDNLSPDQINKLPTWQHVLDLYGPDVVIVGKDRCADFRKKVPLTDRKVGVAGLFNTGTNLLDLHLMRNVHGVENLWQVPWGKHRMAEVKWNHTAKDMAKYRKEDVLPVVIVRDPLSWLQSMCTHPYAAKWRFGRHHCPNFIPNDGDREHFKNLKDVFQVRVKFDQQSSFSFTSLAHLYSEWHQQYLTADYPVLFVRFEDLVFSPRTVLSEIADCLGAKLTEPLKFQVKTSKAHGSGTDFVRAIIKTANADLRLNNLTAADMEYVQEHLDPKLMALFHYHAGSVHDA